MKICHLADIQIRFGSRHDEYRQVFERLYEDLVKQKPDRIYVAGDLVHHKINMSPGSFNLLAEFLLPAPIKKDNPLLRDGLVESQIMFLKLF